MIGRKGSKGFPGKNTYKIFGKSICEYPLIACQKVKKIDRFFISTDCDKIKKVTKKYNVTFLNRSSKLSTDKALGDDVFVEAYFQIKEMIEKENKKISLVILLFANVATINSKMVQKGINLMKNNKNLDSAVSVSKYNMWSPLRARQVNKKNNCLQSFVPLKSFGNLTALNCDRDSQGDVFFADMSFNIVRPKCLENINKGTLPQRWMGKKIGPIYSEAGFDIDYKWQLPQLKYWIKKYGKKN